MIELKDNYQDDVLDSEKNQLRKYNMIQNDDGTVSFVDATVYSQIGDNFGAKDINDIVARIGEVSKAENIDYDGDKSVQGAIDECVRTLGYTVSKNQLKLSGSVGETIASGSLSITKTSENVFTYNGVFSSTYVEMGYTFTRETSTQSTNFLTLNSNKEYILSVECEGTINNLPTDGFTMITTCDVDGVMIDKVFTITGAGKQSINLTNVRGINRMYVKTISGLDVTNFALKIMLRYADVEDDTFEPYVADLKTLVTNNYENIFVDYRKTFVAKTGQTVYQKVVNRKCLVHLTHNGFYGAGFMTQVDIYANGKLMSMSKVHPGGYTPNMSSITCSASFVLEKGNAITCYALTNADGEHTGNIVGYIQYLE